MLSLLHLVYLPLRHGITLNLVLDLLLLLTLVHLVHSLGLQEDILHAGLLRARTVGTHDIVARLRPSHKFDRHPCLIGHLLNRHASLGQGLPDYLRDLLRRDSGHRWSRVLRCSGWDLNITTSASSDYPTLSQCWTVSGMEAIWRWQ